MFVENPFVVGYIFDLFRGKSCWVENPKVYFCLLQGLVAKILIFVFSRYTRLIADEFFYDGGSF